MSKTISELQAELESILDWFQSDEVSIDQAESKYKQGLELAEEIRQKLSDTENSIKQIKIDFEAGK